MEHFPFGDLVESFSGPITAIFPGQTTITTAGRKEVGEERREGFTGALMPLSQDDINRQSDGNYTEKDRKLLTTYKLDTGVYIEKNGERYKISGESPYSEFTDVYIYYAKGWTK